jgi:glycyl-tRNA synthetase beta chain
VLSLILENGLRVEMFDLITAAAHPGRADAGREIAGFLWDRLKVQQREAGIRHDLIDAVGALRQSTDNWLIIRRVQALQSFIGTDDGANLLIAYKRAANILKKEEWPVTPAQVGAQKGKKKLDSGLRRNDDEETLSYTPEPAEKALIAALDKAGPKAAKAVEQEDFEGAMAALASLRAPIDRFFDEVTVNAEEQEKRAARLDLLARFRAAVHKVADFSKIEG